MSRRGALDSCPRWNEEMKRPGFDDGVVQWEATRERIWIGNCDAPSSVSPNAGSEPGNMRAERPIGMSGTSGFTVFCGRMF